MYLYFILQYDFKGMKNISYNGIAIVRKKEEL